MRRWGLGIFVPLLTVLAWSQPADAGTRVALVVGNANYQRVSVLKNPVKDAHLMAERLRAVGFDVIEAADLDKGSFDQSLKTFAARAQNADAAVFYYAGHGVQVDGQNWLIPVDADVTSKADLQLAAENLDVVLAEMQERAKISILFLDACREDPFRKLEETASQRGIALGGGLAPVASAGGEAFVAFAAQPGATASDGTGDHSYFTAALGDAIATPGLGIEDMLKRVRLNVEHATGGTQVPWDNSALSGEFYFVEKKVAVQSSGSQATSALVTPRVIHSGERPTQKPDPDGARALLDKLALAIPEIAKGSDRSTLLFNYVQLAASYVAVGSPDKAHAVMMQASSSLSGQAQDTKEAAAGYLALATAYQAMGDSSNALESARQSLAIAGKLRITYDRLYASLQVARFFLKNGAGDQALAIANGAREAWQTMPDEVNNEHTGERPQISRDLAYVFAKSGRLDDAKAVFEKLAGLEGNKQIAFGGGTENHAAPLEAIAEAGQVEVAVDLAKSLGRRANPIDDPVLAVLNQTAWTAVNEKSCAKLPGNFFQTYRIAIASAYPELGTVSNIDRSGYIDQLNDLARHASDCGAVPPVEQAADDLAQVPLTGITADVYGFDGPGGPGTLAAMATSLAKVGDTERSKLLLGTAMKNVQGLRNAGQSVGYDYSNVVAAYAAGGDKADALAVARDAVTAARSDTDEDQKIEDMLDVAKGLIDSEFWQEAAPIVSEAFDLIKKIADKDKVDSAIFPLADCNLLAESLDAVEMVDWSKETFLTKDEELAYIALDAARWGNWTEAEAVLGRIPKSSKIYVPTYLGFAQMKLAPQ